MTPEQFCYWLQGYFEMTEGNANLSQNQIEMIKSHLALVFHKVTPNLGVESIDGFDPVLSFNPNLICSPTPVVETTPPPTTAHPSTKPMWMQRNHMPTRYC